MAHQETPSAPLLTLDDFDFPYPEHLVAQEPSSSRDASKLLVRTKDGQLKHSEVRNLPQELPAGTLLIFNNSMVFPSRLRGALPTGGQVELFLLQELSATATSVTWQALARPMRKLHEGSVIRLDGGRSATIRGREDDVGGTAFVRVEFDSAAADLAQWLDTFGFIPLPPYIKRAKPEVAANSPDRERYQTVYAAERGSVAAPTAGLHFTPELLQACQEAGCEAAYVSLHVGAGTFLPVKTHQLADHPMHAERFLAHTATVQAIARARTEGRPIVAVGTTTLRCLEALYRQAHGDLQAMAHLAASWQSTNLFIYPTTHEETYRPWVIDGLMTNFHQPRSTLFMLVSSLLGLETARALYAAAVAAEYRLYSYGDTSLLWL